MRYVILLFPMLAAAPVFVAQFSFIDSDLVLRISNFTHSLLSKTSIYSAYRLTGNVNYLYFWIYSLSFVPLTFVSILFWYLCSGDLRKRVLRARAISMWFAIGWVLLIVIGIYHLFMDLSSYVAGQGFTLFPPNVVGCFTFAFTFQFLMFLLIALLLKFMSFLFRF
jgi:hypothetical protein